MSQDSVLVVPIFNEECRWDHTYWTKVAESDPSVRFIFVDDGSTDDTQRAIRETSSCVPSLVLSLQDNRGKAEAVRMGLCEARLYNPTFVGFMDADAAFRWDEASRQLKVLRAKADNGDSEAVFSSRVALAGREIRRSFKRHYLGRALATFLFWKEIGMPYDTQSGLKWFVASSALWDVLERPFKTRWLFDVEILTRIMATRGRPLRVWECPVDEWTETLGSKVTSRELARILGEVWQVKRMRRRYARQSETAS